MMKPIFFFLCLWSFMTQLQAREDALIKLPGNIRLDMENKKVLIPIELVNLSGALEFILSTGKAKDYESLLSTAIKGHDLHFALTSLGFMARVDVEKDADKNSMDLALFVQFSDTKEIRPLTDMLIWSNKKKVTDNHFIFQGSYFRPVNGRNVYEADTSLNLVAAMLSDDMVVGPAFKVGNPYEAEGDAPALLPKAEALPKLGTKGDLIIAPYVQDKGK